MSDQSSDYCRSRADIERKAGEAATLDNVRDRHRRSEAAWIAMAERGERTRQLRDAREHDKLLADALAGETAIAAE